MEPPKELETPEKKELTIKQARWLKAYIETGNGAEAARLAGYQCENDESYRVIGSQNLSKLNVSDLMEEMGLTDIMLVKSVAIGIVKPTKMEKVKQYEGGAADFRETPDYATRAKYLELAAKLKKKLEPTSAPQNNLTIAEGATIQIVNYADKAAVQVNQPDPPITVVGTKSE